MGETYPPVTMPDMNVVFVEPFFPPNQRQFARALADAGTSVRTAWLGRDKPSMKEVLRSAGVPTAASAAVSSAASAHEFAERTGFPLILKPRSGAGASGTVRVDSV